MQPFFNSSFYKGKKVLVTGHTGFKGSWLCKILVILGAEVYGYALEPDSSENLFYLSGISEKIISNIGDIRSYKSLNYVLKKYKPEIVFHLAAQPIVRMAYEDPIYTYETNVMGTVNICECIRQNECVKSFINITTDKVYQNMEWEWGYRECDVLNGFDPYSNSKSCSELITQCFANSYFSEMDGISGRRYLAISTVRAGNVIGGGDFAKDRIIPDCIRAVCENKQIVIRNPNSTRPFQHVLEPLMVYLAIAQHQYEDRTIAGNYNVGPNESDCITVGELVDKFCECWGEDASWICKKEQDAPHESRYLKLDCSKLKRRLSWQPRWSIDDAIKYTCRFSKIWKDNGNISKEMEYEIKEFLSEYL